MVALDLLGRRVALRILWELRGEPLTFRALLEAIDTNPSLLNTRLQELRERGSSIMRGMGYCLSSWYARRIDPQFDQPRSGLSGRYVCRFGNVRLVNRRR